MFGNVGGIRRTVLSSLALLVALAATAGEPLNYGPKPFPEVNPDTWVLIEYWPLVKDITLTAYFMEFSSERNGNLCAAAKRALDRDAEQLAKKEGKPPTAWRKCYTLRDAVREGYLERPVN
jgi:hypothetical protein